MGFEVNLKEFNLGDVLQFLARVKKTGVLKIFGKANGELYLKEGLVVHATAGVVKGIEALFSLTSVELDKGIFDSGTLAPEQTISLEVGKLSEDIEKRRIEFEAIKKSLPPLDALLAKSPKDLESTLALRRTDWQILVLIDGKKKMSEIIAQSKIGGYEAMKIISWLKEQGLIYEPGAVERIMSAMIHYLEILFKDFGKNGVVWLKRWGDLDARNKEIVMALTIDEESMKIRSKSALNPAQIEKAIVDLEEFIKNEGPKLYGKLLFRKKFDDFKQKVSGPG